MHPSHARIVFGQHFSCESCSNARGDFRRARHFICADKTLSAVLPFAFTGRRRSSREVNDLSRRRRNCPWNERRRKNREALFIVNSLRRRYRYDNNCYIKRRDRYYAIFGAFRNTFVCTYMDNLSYRKRPNRNRFSFVNSNGFYSSHSVETENR